MINIPVNKYQTPITEELLNSLPEEVQEELISLLNTVPYIRNLISPNRRYARDLPRDEEGRIIVDLTNPHILEDMDYFRPTAIHFEKYGTLTDLTPNANRNSEYGRWLREERNRIWNGYVRPSDGEWVTGFMYFFLNYCPMKLTKIRKNSKIADRIEGLPEVWEGIYLRFHYIDQARKKGLHGAELASRGKGKSFSLASILTHNFVLGENNEAHKDITSLVIASNLEFLTKDGTITKFINMSDFLAQNTQFPRKRLKSSLQELTWRMGYMDAETMVAKGTKNEVIAVTSNDTISKIRGKRATFIGIEEFGSFINLLSLYNILIPSVSEGDITFGLLFMLGTAGDKSSDFAGAQEIMYNPIGYNMHYVHNVYDKEGNGKPVFVYFFPGYLNRKGCYNNNGVSDVVKALIEILMHRYKVKYNVTDHDTLPRIIAEVPITPAEAIMKVGVNMFPAADASEALQQLDNDPHWDSDIYVGELIFNKSNQVEFRPTGDIPIREYPLKNNKAVGAIEILKMPERDKNGLVYTDRYVMGCIPKGTLIPTIGGFKKVEEVVPGDKLYSIEGNVSTVLTTIPRYTEEPIYYIKVSNIYRTTPLTGEHPVYCSTPINRYRGVNTCARTGLPQRFKELNFEFKKAKDVRKGDYIRVPNVYCEERPIDNTIWDKYSPRVDYTIESPLNNKDFWWFMGLTLGDGWSSGNGYTLGISFNAKEKCYIDKAYNIITSLFNRNVFISNSKPTVTLFYFCCAHLNRFFTGEFGRGAINKQIPEWVKFLPKEYKVALLAGYLASDGCVSGKYAEFVSISYKLIEDIQDISFSLGIISSVTLLRAKRKGVILGNKCTQQDTYHLRICGGQLDKLQALIGEEYKINKYVAPVYLNHQKKDCFLSEDNKYIFFKVKNIRTSSYKGVVYNYSCDTHTYMCKYLPVHNCDPFDDDSSNTSSLGSIYVLDLWTDKYVARYTGRPSTAEGLYEIARRLCLFYNARLNYENNKKGTFAYFSKMNCLYLLTDTLEFLRDKDMIKENTVGNKSKGTLASAPINHYGLTLFKNYLTKPVTVIDKDGKESTIMNIYTIRDRALLKEIISFNSVGNFDRISSNIMLMLLREAKMITYSPYHNEDNKDYLGNDPFFNVKQ